MYIAILPSRLFVAEAVCAGVLLNICGMPSQFLDEYCKQYRGIMHNNIIASHYQKSRTCRGIPFMHVTRLIDYHNTWVHD